MREIRTSGSEGGVALTTPSLPLSSPHRKLDRGLQAASGPPCSGAVWNPRSVPDTTTSKRR